MTKIELLLLDVDGTLTQGDVTYTQNGEEIKSFNIKDGLALYVWNVKLARKSAVITGRECEIVKKRAEELGIEFIYTGVSDKGAVAKEILAKLNLGVDKTACIGDDLNDLPLFRLVEHSYAPKDCADDIRKEAKVVLSKKGGKGAVREMIEDILRKEGKDELKKYFS